MKGAGPETTGGGTPVGAGRDWAELLRVSALFTVPGDALAGAAATGLAPNRRTLLAIAASLSLYEAGMALNDWADREEDAVERPHRPLPSGRIAPPVAFGAAVALTAGGLALAAAAGRPALTVAGALAATVWAYDLGLKHTPAGPAAMAAARSLDVLLGAAATSGLSVGARPGALVGARPGASVEVMQASSARTMTASSVGVVPGSSVGVMPGSSVGVMPGSSAGAMQASSVGVMPGSSVGAMQASSVGVMPGSSAGAMQASSVELPRAGLRGSGPALRAAVPTALVLGAHTLAVTAVSRREAQGGSTAIPLAALAATAALTRLLAPSGGARSGRGSADTGTSAGGGTSRLSANRGGAATRGLPGITPREPSRGRTVGQAVGRAWRTGGVTGPASGLTGSASGRSGRDWRAGARGAVQAALAVTYAATAARPLLHAALNPSPQLTQRAVGGGIRAMIPLQAALSARAGALVPALLTAALAPAARKFGRKVSVT
ncbi:UbiA family prenyltransferase [Streptomyces sp. NPDC050147]|uniref:UbiA family prenyltransferase n=1 Tax=Streptomyces sp. NPDC050147 TaxID=3155513 RepID=UPI00342C1DD4